MNSEEVTVLVFSCPGRARYGGLWHPIVSR